MTTSKVKRERGGGTHENYDGPGVGMETAVLK